MEDRALPEMPDNALPNKMGEEHQQLRALLDAINKEENPELLSDFSELLTSHIRFEERTLSVL